MQFLKRFKLFVCIVLATCSAESLAASAVAKQPDLNTLPAGLVPIVARDMARELPQSWHARRDGEHAQMRNATHSYTMTFSGNGAQLNTDQGHRFGMRLIAYGRGNQLIPTHTGRVSIDNTRVEIVREHLHEWYVNSQLGIEQGFTLHQSPRGPAQSAVTLRFAIDGDLSAQRVGSDIALNDARGNTQLRYEKLHAVDATGRTLPASVQLAGNTLALQVQDRNAVYPITIDPLFTSAARLSSADSTQDDLFGWSVAAYGDAVVVGAPNSLNYRGAVYVYVKPAGGWSNTAAYTAKLTTTLGQDHLGMSVGIWDNVIVAGAPTRNQGNVTISGAAYLFIKPSTGWTTTSRYALELTCPPHQQDQWFGSAVSIWRDTIAVGAYQRHTPGTTNYAGAVCMFEKPPKGWNSAPVVGKLIQQSDPGPGGDSFGWSVALRRNMLVVGAFGHQAVPNIVSGAVYVYKRPPTGWTNTSAHLAKLTVANPGQSDYLGVDVAVSDNTRDIFAGAPGRDRPNCLNCGAAYVFRRPPGDWKTTDVPTAEITAPDSAQNDQFGFRLAVSGNNFLAVGTPTHDANGMDSGAVYTYERPPGGWTSTNSHVQKILAVDGAQGDWFGFDMTASPQGTFVAGAYRKTTNVTNAGVVYVLKP